MPRYYCSRCNQEFEADQERCPKCLRQSTVRPVSKSEPVHGRRLLSFTIRFGLGLLIFFLLTLSGSLLGMSLEGTFIRIYVIVLGGLLLAAGWSFFPKIDPARRILRKTKGQDRV
jgi:DNA-directed RNA polymerase subunit RPC12/RpoP